VLPFNIHKNPILKSKSGCFALYWIDIKIGAKAKIRFKLLFLFIILFCGDVEGVSISKHLALACVPISRQLVQDMNLLSLAVLLKTALSYQRSFLIYH